MSTGRIKFSKVVGLTAIAATAAISLSAVTLNAYASTSPPKQQQVNLTNTGIAPTYTDLSTLIIAGYESPETSTIATKPASAP